MLAIDRSVKISGSILGKIWLPNENGPKGGGAHGSRKPLTDLEFFVFPKFVAISKSCYSRLHTAVRFVSKCENLNRETDNFRQKMPFYLKPGVLLRWRVVLSKWLREGNTPLAALGNAVEATSNWCMLAAVVTSCRSYEVMANCVGRGPRHALYRRRCCCVEYTPRWVSGEL